MSQTRFSNTYSLGELLGQGNQSHVYRLCTSDGAPIPDRVAKVINLAKDEGSITRAKREVRAYKNIDSPRVPEMHEFFEERNTTSIDFIIIMDEVPGKSLDEVIAKQGNVPNAEQVARVTREVSEALAAAHRVDVIHRDVKPANVMLDPESGAKLIDFGLAREVGGSTAFGSVVVGTQGYMSPQQWKGEFSAEDDIYSLGATVTAYALGRELTIHDNPQELVRTKLGRLGQLQEPLAMMVDPDNPRLRREGLAQIAQLSGTTSLVESNEPDQLYQLLDEAISLREAIELIEDENYTGRLTVKIHEDYENHEIAGLKYVGLTGTTMTSTGAIIEALGLATTMPSIVMAGIVYGALVAGGLVVSNRAGSWMADRFSKDGRKWHRDRRDRLDQTKAQLTEIEAKMAQYNREPEPNDFILYEAGVNNLMVGKVQEVGKKSLTIHTIYKKEGITHSIGHNQVVSCLRPLGYVPQDINRFPVVATEPHTQRIVQGFAHEAGGFFNVTTHRNKGRSMAESYKGIPDLTVLVPYKA